MSTFFSQDHSGGKVRFFGGDVGKICDPSSDWRRVKNSKTYTYALSLSTIFDKATHIQQTIGHAVIFFWGAWKGCFRRDFSQDQMAQRRGWFLIPRYQWICLWFLQWTAGIPLQFLQQKIQGGNKKLGQVTIHVEQVTSTFVGLNHNFWRITLPGNPWDVSWYYPPIKTLSGETAVYWDLHRSFNGKSTSNFISLRIFHVPLDAFCLWSFYSNIWGL